MRWFALLVLSVLVLGSPWAVFADSPPYPYSGERYPYDREVGGNPDFLDGYAPFYGLPSPEPAAPPEREGRFWVPEPAAPPAWGGARETYPRDRPEGEVWREREGRLWVPAPSLPDPDRRGEPFGRDPYSPDRREWDIPRLYDQFQPRARPESPRDWREEEVPRGFYEPAQDFPPARGYRFRGDDTRFEDAHSRGGTWYQGYRFRPLNEQERRSAAEALPGWRPLDQRRPAERAEPPPLERPYERRSDDWFERYFGRRGY